MIQLLQNRAIWLIIIIISSCKSSDEPLMPFINKPDFSPEWIKESDPEYAHIHQIPAFSFIDQDSLIVTEKTVEGKIYVANFIFTRCMSICPKMTANMGILQEKFKDDPEIVLLSHSVTPDLDSVPILKKYAEDHAVISGKWHLLTGKQDDIYRLARKEYFAGDTIGYYQQKNEFLHTENFILLDTKRRIRGVYNGTLPIEMERLSEDIATLKKED